MGHKQHCCASTHKSWDTNSIAVPARTSHGTQTALQVMGHKQHCCASTHKSWDTNSIAVTARTSHGTQTALQVMGHKQHCCDSITTHLHRPVSEPKVLCASALPNSEAKKTNKSLTASTPRVGQNRIYTQRGATGTGNMSKMFLFCTQKPAIHCPLS